MEGEDGEMMSVGGQLVEVPFQPSSTVTNDSISRKSSSTMAPPPTHTPVLSHALPLPIFNKMNGKRSVLFLELNSTSLLLLLFPPSSS